MTVRIRDIIAGIDRESPFDLAENWDNVGLLVGSPEHEVRKILLGLDPTTTLVDEAIARGADTIITHHPVIFKPLPRIDTSTPEGSLLQKALTHQIAIIACHTNLDSSKNGVSDILASELGLTEIAPLIPTTPGNEAGTGIGRVGCYAEPIAIREFVDRALNVLGLPVLQVAGPLPEMVGKVAVCGGSGSDLAETAYASGADIYLTAEVKHNIARWAEERDFCIIDGSHYGTEQPAIRLLAEKLSTIAAQSSWKIEILQTVDEKSPFVWLHQNSLTQE
ncbi:Nif3-like dinuclear metal center hexameric protein [Desulfopila aestuarii]|nr:Nif3-like dinuclear metal center hexameric protein [Desulfopila aestuarii]